jgi:serine/threonine protein kinase
LQAKLLKPELTINLMLQAKLLKPELGQGTMQTMVGTPSYIAPEILERETDGYGPEVSPNLKGVLKLRVGGWGLEYGFEVRSSLKGFRV